MGANTLRSGSAFLPLLWMNLRLPIASVDDEAQREFLFRNTKPADTILLYSRTANLCILVLLLVLMGAWMRRHFDTLPALVSVLILVVDPNLRAHGRYATLDMQVTFFIVLGSFAWNEFLDTGRPLLAALTGMVLGCAVATKYSAAILVPLLVLLYLVEVGTDARRSGYSLVLFTQAFEAAARLGERDHVYGPIWGVRFRDRHTLQSQNQRNLRIVVGEASQKILKSSALSVLSSSSTRSWRRSPTRPSIACPYRCRLSFEAYTW
jgi:hypothetical protein